MKRNTTGGSLFPLVGFSRTSGKGSATMPRIGQWRKFPTNSFIHFYGLANNAATLIARLLRNPLVNCLSLSLSLSLSQSLTFRLSSLPRRKMQTIIRGTIGPTRLSLVIGNESPSGRRQSAKSLVFHFPPLPTLSPPPHGATLLYGRYLRGLLEFLSRPPRGVKETLLLAHDSTSPDRETSHRNLHQQKDRSRLYRDSLAYFSDVVSR